MPALPFVNKLLGWTERDKPNMADTSSPTSVAIAEQILEALEITQTVEHVGQTAGKELEEAVETHLGRELPMALQLEAPPVVSRKEPITTFAQYRHLADLERLIDADKTRTLKASIGTDYVIKPDVTVGLDFDPEGPLFLHAAVPCKWTLRSDRAQNVRHEAVVLIRHRRGRLPHITPVTAEPLPTRLASLARGTAEVDAVYHVALDELVTACAVVDNAKQVDTLGELIVHNRLKDLSTLAETLSI
jgi:NgoMIV restriction enzyme